MRLIIRLTILLLTTQANCIAQSRQNNATVAFYNVENLFDTKDDPDTWDDEFTPHGAYRYTEKVYLQKLHNIATVIKEVDPDIIGLAEVENNTVLKGLIQQPELQKHHYKYIWYDSPDPRGIDVALLYDPAKFTPVSSRNIHVSYTGLKTRDVLYVTGRLEGSLIHLLVNHWPSRREGVRASEPKRIAAAKVNRHIVDSLFKQDANSRIFIMGDMNDNPEDKSITTTLQASGTKKDKKTYLYNPWLSLHTAGAGTSVYHRQWDLFDQLIISGSIVSGKDWHLQRVNVFNEPFIRNKKYGADGYPLRSFRGRYWNNGYSDHFPVIMYLHKD